MINLFFGAPAPPPGHLYNEEAVGGQAAVYELDLLVLAMSALSCVHAYKHKQWPLIVAGFGLGLVVEHASLRLGGTHCHQSGVLDFAQCSSANSVVYYLPWVYSMVTIARRLVDESAWSFPLITGMCFFGMCGVYESQGPTMGWWLWPQPDMLVKAGCDTRQFGIPATDPRGLVASQHAYEALYTRVYGVPATAPYFHFAFGWGIAYAYQLLHHRNTLLTALACCLLGPALGLIWDPPLRVLDYLIGVDQLSAVQGIMALAFALPMILGCPLKTAQARDPLLFAIPLLNGCFFVHNALFGRGAGVIPPPLKLFVAGLALAATAAYGRGCGMWRASVDSTGKQAPTYPLSFLDRLQKDAQAAEMDHSNTHPLVFLLLTAIQPPIVASLATAFGVPAFLGMLPIASHALMFLVSHYVLKSNKLFDITGELTFFPLILYSHSHASPSPSNRQYLLTALALFWCTRLGLFLGIRIFVRGSDWRFDKLLHGAAYSLFGWVCQGTWIFLTGLCVWLCHAAPRAAAAAPINFADWLGVHLALAGIGIAHISDMQKTSWNAQYASGAQKKWIDVGLWAWSRHPNYFGEILAWFGMSLVAFSGLEKAWYPRLLCWVSPLWSGAFLVFTSLMLLEKRIDAKFGGQAEYEEYKRNTSVLFLWPPKSA